MPTDALEKLQQITFDGLDFVPCQTIGLQFKHSQSARQYPYVDGDGHDHTGRRSMVMPVRLLFLNTLVLEQPGVQLFPGVFNSWLERLLDGRSGNLEHPIYGNRRARVDGGSADLNAEVRSGVILDVTFIETLDEPEQQIQFQGPNLAVQTAAFAAQEACDALGIDYPDGKLGDVDLLTAVKSVLGQLDSASRQIDGKIKQVQSAVLSMLDEAERLNDHNAYAAVDNLTTLWGALKDLREHLPVKIQRAVRSAITVAETTLDQLALQRGNSLDDMMNLNPQLLEDPIVKRGIAYKYFLDSNDAKASFIRS